MIARILIALLFLPFFSIGQELKIGLLKYNGGGDWYANLETSLPNLIEFSNEKLNTNLSTDQAIVEVGSNELFNFPLIHMTGHGNVVFNAEEAQNLRRYLLAGGFLHIDDNYGMDKFIRLEMKKVFPELEFIALPYSHPIYHQSFDFKEGVPKIHEHDDKPAIGYGLVYNGKLVCFYSYESDLGDGWESQSVHNDPDSKRQEALKMGCNIIEYSFLGEGSPAN